MIELNAKSMSTAIFAFTSLACAAVGVDLGSLGPLNGTNATLTLTGSGASSTVLVTGNSTFVTPTLEPRGRW